ncbi:MAG: hypothetical protein C5B47_05195 [Verrucomicrobia bacterium]|nr:MAG: hypothetical protein C5B47_05195 [Verrucomicrobiota bacterium]
MFKIFKYPLCFVLIFVGVNVSYSTGGKRVYIDKSTQTLTAYEGDQVVLRSHISTGRSKSPTPSGNYQVGVKERMHRSRLYDNAPMPYSVQFNNNYFIHGFSSVPRYPASHGCVRMPIGNAQKLFSWINAGTPVTVGGGQSKPTTKGKIRKKSDFTKRNRATVKKVRTDRTSRSALQHDIEQSNSNGSRYQRNSETSNGSETLE